MNALSLRTIAASALMLALPALGQTIECKNHYILSYPCVPCPEDSIVGPPAASLAQDGKVLALATEFRQVVKGPMPRLLQSLVVSRLHVAPDGTATRDRTWGDCGLARVPIWGQDDAPRAIAMQPDGKLLVLGVTADPREYLILDWTMEPHYYLALIRLERDGTLDPTFGEGGRRVFRVGEVIRNEEYDVNSLAADLEVRADGSIHVGYHGYRVATFEQDGSIAGSYATAPHQVPIVLGLHVRVQFINDLGERIMITDPDAALLLDRGGKWYRTGIAFSDPPIEFE